MLNKNYCTIYLVRHGETNWNINQIIMGHEDSPLTEKGINQAKSTAKEFKGINFEAIFSSDSLRARKTAKIIKEDRNITIKNTKLLRERHYGKFEGVTVSKYKEATKNLDAIFEKLPEEDKWLFRFDSQAENDQELINRFLKKVKRIAKSFPNKNVLIVTHGGCIRTFLMKMGYATRAELQPGSFGNAGYVKLISNGTDFFIKKVASKKPDEYLKK
jgi:broad specificity phosphatase PhoE